MRSHAKAQAAGSNRRQAGGLGGALAGRGGSRSGDGSGAPAAAGPVRVLLLALVTLALAVATSIPALAAGGPPFLAEFEAVFPRGIATAPETAPKPGRVYVSEQNRNRVAEFTPWGTFVRAWGWGVEDGSNELQTCTVQASCLPGASGGGGKPGEFTGSPQGVAVDSEGDVYALESRCCGTANRLQKFDLSGPEPAFEWMVGGEVNKTKVALREEQEAEGEPVTVTEAEENLCTAASGDECGAGTPGSGDGQFPSSGGSMSPAATSLIAITPDDKIYVGVFERIQRFNAAGEYQGDVAVPGEGVHSLAADSGGNLYASYVQSTNTPKADIHKLSPAGADLATFSVTRPTAIAIGPENEIYVYNDVGSDEILQFSSGGALQATFGEGEFNSSTGIATNHIGNVYVSNSNASNWYVRIYGPPPNELEPPPAAAPSINDQTAISVDTTSATVRALINPHFWPDAVYNVQYGPTACVESGWTEGCAQRPVVPSGLSGGSTNTDVIADVTLPDLEPHTLYHFRFAAQSSGGGPVIGLGGTEGEVGEADTFATFASPTPRDDCLNQALRTGPSASLPDCRAYEMVSPVDKNGGQIITYEYDEFGAVGIPTLGTDQSALDGERITYSSTTSFGDEPSTPFVSQYLADRVSGQGWTAEGISPPERGGKALGPEGAFMPIYRAFSPDLSFGLLVPESGLQPLAPCAVLGFNNVYRRDTATGQYTAMCSVSPEPEAFEGRILPEVQGHSADGSRVVFRVNNTALTPNSATASGGDFLMQLYEWSEGEVRLVSVLPSGVAHQESSSAGIAFHVGEAANARNLVERAVSADGRHVYWTDTESQPGNLYLRTNADQAQSAQANGSATGAGDLSVVSALSLITEGSTEIQYFFASGGEFAVGEPISGPGIPEGATIVELLPGTIVISDPATSGGVGTVVSASRTVANLGTSTGAFAVGQTIAGPGIPAETTVEAVGPEELTLSASPTQGGTEVALEAFSECTEADRACTIPVSGAATASPAQFWTASADGSRAVFSVPSSGDLYEFDLATREATLIAGDTHGVLGADEDLANIYFASEEVLTEGEENSEGDAAQLGQPNLYLYREGAFSFVATLAPGDLGDSGPLSELPGTHYARVSLGGGHIAFVSLASLTGYDNRDAGTGQPAREVFTYEADGALTCVSCNPSGARPAGASTPGGRVAAWIPGRRALNDSRSLSADGSRVFFNSFDALAPRDSNGVQDVYQWEKPGTGDCTEASPAYSVQNQGCVSLISTGQSQQKAEFVDASDDGRDVFIRTPFSLDPRDPGELDIYDARAGGGFPAPEAISECEGDACQNVPDPPLAAAPASSSYRGAGNASAARRSCAGAGARAGRLSRRAKRLRRNAERVRGARRSKRLHRKAGRLAKRARRLSGSAKRCRQAKRRARTNRRASR